MEMCRRHLDLLHGGLLWRPSGVPLMITGNKIEEFIFDRVENGSKQRAREDSYWFAWLCPMLLSLFYLCNILKFHVKINFIEETILEDRISF